MTFPRTRFAFAAVLAASLIAACGGGGTTATTTGSSSGSGAASGSGAGGQGGQGGALPPPKSLSVMDWNLHDYFDTVYDNPDEIVLSSADYKGKRAGIGAVINALAPDIVMVAEIETKHILDDLNSAELGSAYVDTELFEGNDPRGINVGLLSKVMPDKVVSHKDDNFTKIGTNGPVYRYSRDCLEVHLTWNGRHMAFLGVHFKAKTAPDDPDKRLAEAQHTRAIADDIVKSDPSAAVIILGDYNDEPGSDPVNAVAGADPTLFVDAADFVPTSERYSFVYSGTPQLIDHQMGNPLAAKLLDPSTVVIKHGVGVDDKTKYASDHAPIYAVYQVQ